MKSALIAGLLALAAMLIGSTLYVTSHGLRFQIDDAGGGGGGYTTLLHPMGPEAVNHLAAGYFSVVDAGGSVIDGGRDADWTTVTPVTLSPHVAGLPRKSTGTFASFFYGIEQFRVDQAAYAYAEESDGTCVIVTYTVTNKWLDAFTDLYASVWFHFEANGTDAWPITESWDYDPDLRMACQFDPGQSYVGVAALGGMEPHSVRATMPNSDPSPFPDTDMDEMVLATSGTIDAPFTRFHIATMLSFGPFDLGSEGSVTIPIAIVAGGSLDELKAAALAAHERYDLGPGNPRPSPATLPPSDPGSQGDGGGGGGGCGAGSSTSALPLLCLIGLRVLATLPPRSV